MSEEEQNELRQKFLSRGYNSLLEYDELVAIGTIIYGDVKAVSLFGLTPKELFERDIRICARTGIEGVHDMKAVPCGLHLAEVIVERFPNKQVVGIAPFLGSGNLLYTTAKYTKAYDAFGFDNSRPVYELAVANYAKINFDAKLFYEDCANIAKLIRPLERSNAKNEVFFICINPPWGDAFDFTNGLRLNKTIPPFKHLIEMYTQQFATLSIVFVVILPEKVDEESLNELLSISSFYQIFYKGTRKALLILAPKSPSVNDK